MLTAYHVSPDSRTTQVFCPLSYISRNYSLLFHLFSICSLMISLSCTIIMNPIHQERRNLPFNLYGFNQTFIYTKWKHTCWYCSIHNPNLKSNNFQSNPCQNDIKITIVRRKTCFYKRIPKIKLQHTQQWRPAYTGVQGAILHPSAQADTNTLLTMQCSPYVLVQQVRDNSWPVFS